MNAITLAFAALFILLSTSCSENEQSTSPIIPDANQISKSQEVLGGTYQYLQCFQFVPVASVNSSQLINSIEIVISPDNFPKFFMHMFVTIEYSGNDLPLKEQLIFVGKPITNVIVLNDVSYRNLKSVKVYAYVPTLNGNGISQPYDYLTKFKELEIELWEVQQNAIQIVTGDWLPNLTDTFVQFELSHPANDGSTFVLTYISHPENGKVIIPKFFKESIVDIKMFGYFVDTIVDNY